MSESKELIPSGSIDLPEFGLVDLWRHENLSDARGPWAGDVADAYSRDMRRANLSRAAQGLGSEQDEFPSRLFRPDEEVGFQTGATRPEYIVISYTWGRWRRDPPANDTPVAGCHWQVPHNRLFTRSELTAANRNISCGSNAWVDVFCIPRIEDDPENAREIGKQGAIFRNGSRACVWLGTGGEDALREVCSRVSDSWSMLAPDILAFRDVETYKPGPRSEANILETRRRIHLIASFTDRVPWVSSL